MDRKTLRKLPLLLGGNDNIYLPKEAKIKKVTKMTDDTYLFRLKNNLLENPLPGQFLEVSVIGVGEAPISICNYDNSYIELLIKNVGDVTSHLCKLKEKDKMLIRGPYGNGYPMSELKKQNIVIIAGGTGIAPPRSVIQYILNNKSHYKDISIFLGFRSEKDILFKEDIEAWKHHCKVHVTLDNPSKDWKGDSGVITSLLDKYKLPKSAKFVLCGPPIMIKFTLNKLIEKNYEDKDIFISFERNMKCGVGKCGHCMIHGKYVCTDGPVFKYDISKKFTE